MAVVSETTIIGEGLLVARAAIPDGRVLIALDDGPLVSEPTWTAFDDLSNCRCYGFDWQRGRQSEFDVTDTGTARVYFHDRADVLADDALVGCQIVLQLYDPVAESYEPVFRGHIDDVGEVPDPFVETLGNVQIDCVDIFDYLAGVKMVVGQFGAPNGPPGVVFYEDGPVATGTNDPSDGGRIELLLEDAGLSTEMYAVFSGNVDVNETLYDPNDTILQAVRDAADAEFPGIANVYVDRFGRVAFHGRFARFTPDDVATDAGTDAWDFHRWNAATREDVTTGRAQIRTFSFNRPRTRIVNSYVAWPRADENGYTFDQTGVDGLVRTDSGSVSTYGWRGREAPDLIIKEHKTNGNTGAEECGLFGDFYVANYAQPRKNIQNVTFLSIHPSDARAEDTWELMTKIDISDIIHLFVDEAGLNDVEFYVEGISGECRPLNPEFDFVSITPNLSPKAYYGTDVFGS